MKPALRIAFLLLIAALVCAAPPARGEEIILKDGQKIVGTIVGYEKDMFRVETDFGIALVRKDKVASIQVSKPDAVAKPSAATSPQATPQPAANIVSEKPTHVAAVPEAPPAPAPAPPPPVKPTATVKPDAATVSRPSPQPPAAKNIGENPVHVAAAPEAVPPSAQLPPSPAAPAKLATPPITPAKVATPTSPPLPVKPPTPPPPPVSHPVDEPMPAHLEEHVDGNTFFSDTFQFSMFKPPGWKIYEGVPKETGSGIMAMGTEDEQTLLIVDRQVWSGTPKLTSDQVEANLRQTYQEYQRISEDAIQCGGRPATLQTFTGVLDGAEWHGVAVHVIHGNMVFGITGLTSAESFQFQEAIFNKIIKTFHFVTSPTPTEARPNP